MAQKLIGFLQVMVPKVPLILTTTLHHYVFGPPKPSWSVKFNLTVTLLRSFLQGLNNVPIKESQALSRISEEDSPIDPRVEATSTLVPLQYREQATEIMERLLRTKYGQDMDSHVGWDWKNDVNGKDAMVAEWTDKKPLMEENTAGAGAGAQQQQGQAQNKSAEQQKRQGRTVLYLHGGGYILGSILTHRWATAAMCLEADAKVLSIDYRLAPESPFPAALVDAMAAYMFLLNPPKDAGFEAISAKDIVIMGDSAGGGLTFGLMLALRDGGIAMPGGVAGLSPWLDLLHSMPSVMTNNRSDYLPEEGFTQGGRNSFRQLAAASAKFLKDDQDYKQLQGKEQEAIQTRKEILLHQSSELSGIQYYATNVLLDCPYVSPLVEKDLEGTCPMMVIAGDGELLRDEAIVFAEKNAGSSQALHLLVYDDMPHVFPMFSFLPISKDAMHRVAMFIKAVTQGSGNDKENDEIRYYAEAGVKSMRRVGVDCQTRPLEKDVVSGWQSRVGRLGGGHEFMANLQM